MNYLSAQQFYEACRTRCYLLFDSLSRALTSSIGRMLPMLEGLQNFVDAFQTSDPTLDDETLIARSSIRRMCEGVRVGSQAFMRLADISEIEEPSPEDNAEVLASLGQFTGMEELARIPPAAYDAVQNLRQQYSVIRDAALLYTITNDNWRRMVFEHNLVRAGADVNDIIDDRFGGGKMRSMLDRLNYSHAPELERAMREVFANYNSVLAAYDLMAKLKQPSPDSFEEEHLSNISLIECVLKDSPEDEPRETVQHLRFQFEVGL